MIKEVKALLEKANVECEYYKHEPILDYETAERVAKEVGFTGTESKSLFIKAKSGKYYMYLTLQGMKMDSKEIKNLIGEKVGVVSGEELTEKTGCIPGCAAPFGYVKEISLIVDESIFDVEKYIFSQGVAEITMILKGKDIKKVLDICENKVIYYRKN